MNVSHRSIFVLLLLVALLGQTAQTSAKGPLVDFHTNLEGGSLVLSRPETNQFPTIRFRFDVYDSRGEFISGLTTSDITVQEDKANLQPESVETVKNGVQTIIVLNLGPEQLRQTNGASEYQRAQTALLDWVATLPKRTLDDFSLVTPIGMYLIRSTKPGDLTKALTDYQPDPQNTQPSLNSLAEALDLATDPLDAPLTKRTILYFTPQMEGNNIAPLADLTDRAKETGARIHVVLLNAKTPAVQPTAAPDAAAASTVEPQVSLQTLAEQTGGQFLQVVAGGSMPEIEPLVAPMRTSYQAAYQSAIQKSGAHQFSVQVMQGGQNLTSQVHRFEMNVLPPNPIFLSPPNVIERDWEVLETGKEPALAPNEIPLEILVEFPDQHKRPLKATRLLMDGALVDENTAPPFNEFRLPVETLDTTGTHRLQVQAEDTLGLTGTSIEIPVEVIIQQPAAATLTENVSEQGMVAIGAIAFSGAALALVLVLTSRKRWGRRKGSDKKRMKDPLTQPVNIRQENARPRKENGISKTKPLPAKPAAGPTGGSAPAAAHAPTWPPAIWQSASWPRTQGQTAPARMVRLDENEQPITGGALPLTRLEVTFGSDPRHATQVLETPTVDGLHARLYRTDDGKFYLADQNSIAGTWVNYAPVSSSGVALEHGDLIHIGKVTFRFELTDPAKILPVEIQVVNLSERP